MLALASYSSFGKSSAWAYPVALISGLMANAAWMHLARSVNDSTKLAILGLYWDLMLTGIYLAVPILFFGARFGTIQALGIALIFIGIVLVKI